MEHTIPISHLIPAETRCYFHHRCHQANGVYSKQLFPNQLIHKQLFSKMEFSKQRIPKTAKTKSEKFFKTTKLLNWKFFEQLKFKNISSQNSCQTRKVSLHSNTWPLHVIYGVWELLATCQMSKKHGGGREIGRIVGKERRKKTNIIEE